ARGEHGELVPGAGDAHPLDAAQVEHRARRHVPGHQPGVARGPGLSECLQVEEADHGDDHEGQRGRDQLAAPHVVVTAELPPNAGCAVRMTWTGALSPSRGTGSATDWLTSAVTERASAEHPPGRRE